MRRLIDTCLICVTMAVGALWLTAPVAAQVSGISYTVTPSAEYTLFHDDSGLGDAPFLGGRVGFGFGEFVEVAGILMFANGVDTDFSSLSGFDQDVSVRLGMLPSRSVDLRRYGGEIGFNIGRGKVTPLLSVGTGILRLQPEGLRESETVYLSGGLGVRYSYRNRYTFHIKGTSLSYRYNPASTLLSEDDLTQLALTADDFELVGSTSFGISAGLQLYLGGRARGELTDLDRELQSQFSRGLRGLAIKIEPVVAEIDFDEAFGYRSKQRMTGAAVGLDLGPLVGIRGFYWRGTEGKSFGNFDDLQAYGGEMQLNFGEESGTIRPYINIGGGYLDVMDGYEGNGIATPEDKPFAMGGIGAQIPLSNAVSIRGGVRALLLSTTGADNVSDPAGVEVNTMFSGGIAFGIGRGSRGSAGSVVERGFAESERRSREADERLAQSNEAMAKSQAEITSALAAIDSLTTQLARVQERAAGGTPADSAMAVAAAERIKAQVDSVSASVTESVATVARADSMKDAVVAEAAVAAEAAIAEASVAQPSTSMASVSASQPATSQPARTTDRWVSLPVPEQGELYVRYGPPGSVIVESISGDSPVYVMDPVTGATTPGAPFLEQKPVSQPAASSLTKEDIQEIVRQVVREERAAAAAQAQPAARAANDEAIVRLEKLVDRRLNEIESKIATSPPAAVVQPPIVVQQPAAATQTIITEQGSTSVVSGVQFGGIRPLIGYNLDNPNNFLFGVRADLVRPGRAYRIIPDVIVGIGDGDTTFGINLNGAIYFGGGLFDRIGFDLRPYVGTGVGFLNKDGTELVMNVMGGAEATFSFGTTFVEFMTQDFFDNDRVLLGYRFTL